MLEEADGEVALSRTTETGRTTAAVRPTGTAWYRERTTETNRHRAPTHRTTATEVLCIDLYVFLQLLTSPTESARTLTSAGIATSNGHSV